MKSVLFVLLNVLDAKLTSLALGLGATELNPVLGFLGGNMLLKGLIAALVVCLLAVFHVRTHFVETALCLGIFAVCAWNGINVLTGSFALALLPIFGNWTGP